MFFDAEISEMVRKAVAEGRYDLLYVMVPAMDGGQTYEMKCTICGAFGNNVLNTFIDPLLEEVEEVAHRHVVLINYGVQRIAIG